MRRAGHANHSSFDRKKGKAIRYDTLKVEAFYKVVEQMELLALDLNAVDKTKLTESEDKFLAIRLTRLIHAAEEMLSGKSLSVESGLEKARKRVRK